MTLKTQKPFYIKALDPKHSCGIDKSSTPLFQRVSELLE